MNTSASIRYTAEEHWVIMRGAGLRNENGPGYAQYSANALLLQMRPEYRGPAFCAGDQYIDDIVNGRKNTGTPTTWLQAGMNHHLTLVASQIATLCAS